MTDPTATIVEGDCLDVMKTLPAGSVDLVLCDPPYGITACGWDKILPIEPMWDAYRRLLKPFGAVVLTARQPFASRLILSNLRWFRHEIIWDKVKVTGFLNANREPLKRHENILVFAPHAPVYNPQFTEGRPYRSTRKGREIACLGPKKVLMTDSATVSDGRRYPTSILAVSSHKPPGENHHPTQKPVDLFRWLVRTYSRPGDLVLDNRLGSGTTVLACVAEGRRCVGIERDPIHRATAERRRRAAVAARDGPAPTA